MLFAFLLVLSVLPRLQLLQQLDLVLLVRLVLLLYLLPLLFELLLYQQFLLLQLVLHLLHPLLVIHVDDLLNFDELFATGPCLNLSPTSIKSNRSAKALQLGLKSRNFILKLSDHGVFGVFINLRLILDTLGSACIS